MKWVPDDFTDETAAGFRRPFHTFLIKVASLCNLNCSYCYVYRIPDDSWRHKQGSSEPAIAEHVATAIQQHVTEYDLSDIAIIFHGGEPLLAGLERLQALVSIFSSAIHCHVHWGMQTNGTLMSVGLAEFLSHNNFSIGLSIDGMRIHNDRHRLYHSGASSYEDTVQAIRLLQSYPNWKELLGGVLVVIDIRNDPAAVFEAIVGLNVPGANLLLPDAHYGRRRRTKERPHAYGTWLCNFFDIWFHRSPDLEVPYFEQIVTLMLGGASSAEEIGAKSVDLIVVETNGDRSSRHT